MISILLDFATKVEMAKFDFIIPVYIIIEHAFFKFWSKYIIPVYIIIEHAFFKFWSKSNL